MGTTAAAARGFTLIELAATVAVASIVMTTAAPSLSGWVDTQRLKGVAGEMASTLQYARSEAVMRNQPVRVSFHQAPGGTACYVVHTGNADQCPCDGNAPAPCSGADAQQIKTVALPADQRVSLQANVASLLFDPLHGTATPAATLRLVGADGRAVHHVVNLMGRVRSCSPSSAVSGYRGC